MLYFTGVGREKSRDPYFNHFYRIGFDGKHLSLLTPEDANHDITLSKSGRFFVDSYSKPDVPPVAVLRDSEGKLLSTLEKADISRLLATGWKPPMPFVVKARDGVTDLYGLRFKPANFEPARKYPIVNHIYPDFFKVGISEAGNHDNREYEDDWGEKWQGLLERRPDGATNYDDQANQNIAKNLKGHLLLAHGTMDSNVPPYNTLLVVNELIKANKDFDLLMLPNRHHGFGNEPYMVRRRWDYFVRYLEGAEPPKEYE